MKRIFLLLFTVVFAQFANATIWFMKPNGSGNGSGWSTASNDLTTILSSAQAGDQIWLAAGTYYTNSGSSFTPKSGVSIYGGFSGTESTLSGRNWTSNTTVLASAGGASTVFYGFSTVSDFLLDGVTVTNGSGYGGGAFWIGNLTGSIKNCIFSNNIGTNGGVVNTSNCNITWDNCKFTENTASGSGGVLYVGRTANSTNTFTNCIFSKNAASGGFGGVVYQSSGDVSNTNTLVLTNCLLYANSAKMGGAVYSDAGGTGNNIHTYRNVTIANNYIAAGYSFGTAICVSNGGNTSMNIYNSIIYDNYYVNASWQAGNVSGLYIGNSDGVTSTPNINVYNSIIGSVSGLGLNVSSGNFLKDPMFANEFFGDYHLTGTSAAINAGVNGDNSQSTDVAGNARVFGSTIDLGAYEYQTAPTVHTVQDITSQGSLTVSIENSNTNENSPKLVDSNFTSTKYLFGNYTSGTTEAWFKWQFTTAKTINEYTITSGNDASERDMKKWDLQGSNDGSTWVTLDSRDSQYFGDRLQTKRFIISSPSAYTYYRINLRLNATNNLTGTSLVQIEEIRLLSYSETTSPVTLTNFNALYKNKSVLLSWNTLSETNNDYFEIQKSTDGISFETLAIVKGAGNSSSKLSYSYSDEAPIIGKTYYRLRQVDYNGTSVYSPIEIVLPLISSADNSFKVYPNPIYNTANITYTSSSNEMVKVQFWNISGALAYTKLFSVSAGTNTLSVNVPTLPAGIYVVSVVAGDGTVYKSKVLISK